MFGAKPGQNGGGAPETEKLAAAEQPSEPPKAGATAGRRDQRRGGQKAAALSAAVEPVDEVPASKPESSPAAAARSAAPSADPPRPTPSGEANPAERRAEPIGATLHLNDLRADLERRPAAGWRRLGASKKVAIGAGLCVALLISAILLKSTFAAKAVSNVGEPPRVETVGPSLISDTQDWNINWNSERGDHQISLYRPSMTLTDYRISYQGQIENRSVGWVFRAANTKNYYVTQLEAIKPGAAGKTAVVHYAVINGENTRRSEKPLPFPVNLDTIYSIRTDVLGTEFSTYINDQLVDTWSDDRLTSGGFGVLGGNTDRARFGLQQLRAAQ